MLNLQRKIFLTGVLLTGLLLTGCSATPNTDTTNEQAPAPVTTPAPEQGGLHWFNTAEGAVQCLSAGEDSGYPTHDCAWATLKPHHTVKNVTTLDGHLVATKLGTLYCLTFYERYSTVYNCDWDHIKTTHGE